MTIVFKVSDNIKEKMIKYYADKLRDKTPPYAVFQAIEADTIITLYESGKVMFQGTMANVDADIWITMEKKLNNRVIDISGGKEKHETANKEIDYNIYNTIGSDEVGTGDFFGPIVVCATNVLKDVQDKLRELNVMDSKKLTDEKIKNIAPIIMKLIPFSAYILANKDYNEYYNKDTNMNKIKAILHNKVLLNLVKNNTYDRIIVDQFTTPRTYYAYLSDVKEKVTNILFTPKAEDQVLSVACASIIARYIFLNEMEKMGNKLGIAIPKGAGEDADKVALELAKNNGLDYLKEFTKYNFKNIDRIKESLHN